MKPGDIVWVFDDFDAPKIHEVTLISVIPGSDGRNIFTYSYDGQFYMQFWGYNVFPTREALCEHYRKIFE